MTQPKHTTLSLRTQLVSIAGGLRGTDARDYFANDRSAQQLGALKAQLERDGFKDVAQHAAVALRIAEMLQQGVEIKAEQALELQRAIIEAIATSLSVELPAGAAPAATDGSAPAAAKPEPLHRTQSLRMVSNRKLGEILVQMSLLTSTQVEQALAHQRMTGCRLGDALIQLRLLPKATVESALRVQGARRNDGGDPWRAVS